MDYYVYVWRDSAGVPFYVGKGKGKRAHLICDRSAEFKNVHDAGNCTVEIVDEFVHESQAHAYEVELIARYGRREYGGLLVNKTDGGEGASGAVVGSETREKLTAALHRRYDSDPSLRAKISIQQRKRQADPAERERHSSVLRKHYDEHPETRAKLSASHKRRYADTAEREKTAATIRVRWDTPSERAKMSSAIRRNGPSSNNTSGFKGVSLFVRTGKWVAKIKTDGRTKNLGYFATPEDAARRYDAAAFEAWGGDCYMNFGHPPDNNNKSVTL